MTRGKSIQVLGTGSGVGKSLIVSAFCRIFLQDGYSTCPFKAQNMALNSFVTNEKREIGRAQAVQAKASGLEPTSDMNPVLIKPTSNVGAQVIVRGKSVGNMSAVEYTTYKDKLFKTVRESFDRLARKYEIVVIEGAGSPAEVNLKAHDIVNMKMAEYADAPVILVGDIDKGGVFAWIVGTLELLTEFERKRVKGIIINKFRGDKTLLMSGIDFLEERTGIKVIGIVPYFKDIRIPEEDSVALENKTDSTAGVEFDSTPAVESVDIAVVQLPHISNFTDFDALQTEPDVKLRYVKNVEEMGVPDVIIIPGTKNTISDLEFLKNSGLGKHIKSIIGSSSSAILVGICGGYQMLGRKIYDEHAIESSCKNIEALGVLSIETYLEKEKYLNQIKAKDVVSGAEVSGYEIHHGSTKGQGGHKPLFEIIERNGLRVSDFEGVSAEDGRVLGTYVHGLFDSDSFRRKFLNRVRLKKGWGALSVKNVFDTDMELDKLADLVRENIDVVELYKILGI